MIDNRMNKRELLTVGIDASWACGNRTGTGRFTLDLVEGLLALDSANSYVLYFRECCRESNPLFQIDRRNVQKIVVDSRSTIFRVLFSLSRRLSRDSVDVFISPAFFLPLYGSKKWIVTFFDLHVYTLSKEWARCGTIVDFLLMRLLFPFSLRKADQVVAISHATKVDLLRLFPFVASKSMVVYPAVKDLKIGRSNRGVTDAEHASVNPYFLYVGNLSPTKNLERAIIAFSEFKKSDKRDYSFVLAGKDVGRYAERDLRPLVKRLQLDRYLRFLGFVSDEALEELYSSAYCLVYPSLSEGFGYPILEAMQFGVPVITSNVSSCPEVGGDAALYVDPLSEQEICEALEKIASDPQFRSTLIKKGQDRWKEFSLERTALGFLEALNRVRCEPQALESR